jgi:hypothetical protein
MRSCDCRAARKPVHLSLTAILAKEKAHLSVKDDTQDGGDQSGGSDPQRIKQVFDPIRMEIHKASP